MEYRSSKDDDYYRRRPSSNRHDRSRHDRRSRSPLHDDLDRQRPSSRHDRFSPYDRRSRSPLDDDLDRQRPSSRHDRFSPSDHHSQRSGNSRGSLQSVCENMDQYRQNSYPKELTDMFEAYYCKLCSTELSSPAVAKMHYSGKPHDKKVTRFLFEWCAKTGAEMPRRESAYSFPAANFEEYCELCEVRLTSVSDKLLHYAGKPHRKNQNNPEKAKRKKKIYDTIDLTDIRFGICTDFSTSNEAEKKLKSNGTSQEFVCELCDVKAVSEDQLQNHLSGKKHKEKMEKKNNSDSSADVSKLARPYKCYMCEVSLETSSLFKKHINGKRHLKTLSKRKMNKTGPDICKVCNLNFTSFEQYQMHCSGKKHEKKYKELAQTITAPPVEKVSITCDYCPYVGNDEEHKCDKSLLELDFEGLDKKYVCFNCNMVYENKEAYEEHKNSRRHLLCVLNKETGDKVVEELIHFYCFICKVQCRNMQAYTHHLFEPKHLTLSTEESDLENKTNLYVCSMCNIVMDQEAKEGHIYDKKHLRKSLQNDTWITLASLVQENITTTNFNCPYCNVSLNSFVKYSEHLLSEEHINTMIEDRLKGYKVPAK